MGEETVLSSMAAICKVLGGIGRRRFLRYIEEGMPVKKDGYSYTADKENVLRWWKERTKKDLQA